MLELKINVPELKDYAKNLLKIKDQFFDLMRLDFKEVSANFIDDLLKVELELFLGRTKYERQKSR